MKYILWDPRDNDRPREDDSGNIISDGVLGRIGPDNVYLTAYANVLGCPVKDLAVGGFTTAEFRLSGVKGTYRIYRVE